MLRSLAPAAGAPVGLPPSHPVRCPALLVAAPASGQGKTTVVAALARLHTRLGRRVRVFKAGPDFLDPTILARASGLPVYTLDLWMGGEAHAAGLLHEAAQDADLILVEGVMGLHDGEPSSATLASRFRLPVLAVIDGSAMAQTFGALVLGLARYRPELRLTGVLANRVAGAVHADLLEASLPREALPDLRWWGALRGEPRIELPERHLGLVPAGELADLDARLDLAADALPAAARELPPTVTFDAASPDVDAPGIALAIDTPTLHGVRLAIARDAAFTFIYPANLRVLEALGAELVFFSPLDDAVLPDCDAVWLPGGYPELHGDALSANASMGQSLRAHVDAGLPLWAECGGLLVLLESLVDVQGRCMPMFGLLPGQARMQPRLAGLGLHEAPLPEGALRGHSFHYSTLQTSMTPLCITQAVRHGRRGEAVYRRGRLTASYFHAYFPSNPGAVARVLAP